MGRTTLDYGSNLKGGGQGKSIVGTVYLTKAGDQKSALGMALPYGFFRKIAKAPRRDVPLG